MGNPELERIRADMARCKERIYEITQGSRGVHTGAWGTINTGESGAGIARERQLLAQSTALQRLEAEYVQAMLAHGWAPADVIKRMETPIPKPTVIERPPSADDIKAAVRQFLSTIPDDATVQSLKDLIQ